MLKFEQEKSNLVPFFFTYSVFLLMVINVGTKLLTLCRQSWMRGGNKPMTPPLESPEQHPGPRKATFLHRWASTDRQGIRGFLSLLLLSLVIITHTVLMRIGAVLLAGAATLLSDFIYPLFVFPELFCERGHQGTPDREEIPALSKGTAWRETHSYEIQLMLNGCTVPLLKKSQRPRHKQLAMSCTLAQEAQSLPQGTCSDMAVLQQSPVVKACLSLRRNDQTPLCNSGFLFCLLPLLPICFHGSNMEKLGFVM